MYSDSKPDDEFVDDNIDVTLSDIEVSATAVEVVARGEISSTTSDSSDTVCAVTAFISWCFCFGNSLNILSRLWPLF